MKQTTFIFVAILLITSCNQKQKVQISTNDSDSIIAVEKRNQEIQDSLNQAKIDSLSLIAWGDTKFGMTKKEVLATEAFKEGYKGTYSNTISMDVDIKSKIKKTFELNLFINYFTAFFQEDELTQIQIESYKLTADEIKNLIADCEIFKKNFTAKYGNPSYECRRVDIRDFESGKVFTYARYRIGNKSITIKLGETSSRYKYFYIIYIENTQFPKKKHVMTDEEIKEAQKQMEEAERIRNNSF